MLPRQKEQTKESHKVWSKDNREAEHVSVKEGPRREEEASKRRRQTIGKTWTLPEAYGNTGPLNQQQKVV